jgi:4-hydroxy-2-oxoheptanedioate aldolase
MSPAEHPATSDGLSDAARLRARWARGETAIGLWSVIADPMVAEVLGASAADVVCVDAQHGYIDAATLPALLQAWRAVGRAPLVRPRWNEPGEIMRVLDAGASGVVVPMVNTGQDALAAARACRYPPLGIRSWGPLWSVRGVATPTEQDAAVLCIVMVETADAVAHLPEILDTPGVDGVYIGPNDLALSCGYGRASYRTSPAVHDLIAGVLATCTAHGRPVGLHCSDTEMAQHWRSRGVSWVTAGTDVDVLTHGVAETVAAFR